MNPADKRLLLRVAMRMERQAKEAYATAGQTAAAKETRDNIIGDALDLRDYVVREERADATAKATLGDHAVLAIQGGAILVPKVPDERMKDAGAAVLSSDDVHVEAVSKTALAKDVWDAMVFRATNGV